MHLLFIRKTRKWNIDFELEFQFTSLRPNRQFAENNFLSGIWRLAQECDERATKAEKTLKEAQGSACCENKL